MCIVGVFSGGDDKTLSWKGRLVLGPSWLEAVRTLIMGEEKTDFVG